MKSSGLLCVLLLSGCASFTPEYDRPDIKPIIVHTPYVENVCYSVVGYKAGYHTLACAVWPGNNREICIVYLPMNPSKSLLEHELKHCRYGKWHE